MNCIFVVGLHRAGTHTIAENIAREKGLLYLDETTIHFDGFPMIEQGLMKGYMPKWDKEKKELIGIRDKRLDDGFVLQCPMIAHKVLQLKQFGEVYWCMRKNLYNVAQSMTIGRFGQTTSWPIMKYFKNEFPDDPIWDKLTYDGSEDFWYGHLHFNYLLVLVRQYFYRTKFKDLVTEAVLEDQPNYDETKSLAVTNPIKTPAFAKLKEAMKHNERACLG